MSALARERLSEVRESLILDHPFFGVIGMQTELMPISERNKYFLGEAATMYTDGVDIFYNDAFVNELDEEELKFVVCHEILHPVLLHLDRLDSRDPQLWNMACDYVINLILVDELGLKMPEGKNKGLYDQKYEGMSADEVYSLLQQDQEQQQQDGESDGGDDGDCDSNSPPQEGEGGDSGKNESEGSEWNIGGMVINPEKGNGQAEKEERNTRMRGLVDYAAKAELHKAGTLPGVIERIVNALLKPELPWTELLKQFVTDKAQTDYLWRKPLKSVYGASGGKMILPSLDGDTIGPIVVAVDTSGSITDELIDKFMGEVSGIFHDCNPAQLHIIDCDWVVHDHWEMQRGDEFEYPQFTGGGGTAFEPVFEFVEQKQIEPCCLVYFTDMYGSFPDEPDYPTMWVSYSGVKEAPFGEVINTQ